MSDEAVVGVVLFGCLLGLPLLCGLAAIVMSEWRTARIAEQNAVLKREMIERGFTADEIVRVLAAGAEPADKIAGTTPQPAGHR